MKKISIFFIVILLGSLYLSCKKDDATNGDTPIDLVKTDVAKVIPILKEATDLFNSGNNVIAAAKADQAKMILNAMLRTGRKVMISDKCPLKYISSDDSTIILALSCSDYYQKKPANVQGAFEENTVLFNAYYKQDDIKNQNSTTEKSIADTIKANVAGTTFTGTVLITDPGVLMEAEKEYLNSYSMSFNVKVLDIQKTNK